MIDLRAEFNSIHQQYYPMVLQLCTGYTKGDRELAADLAQEVFINTWNALPNFKKAASYKTWIYRITVNTCLLHIRDNKKKQTGPLDEIEHAGSIGMAEKMDAQHGELYTAIGGLDKLDRLIIMMVLDELEYEEIAKVVGINPVNLRVKIHRIKTKLRALLNKI